MKMKRYTALFMMILAVTTVKSQINLDDVLYSSISATPRLQVRREGSKKLLAINLTVLEYSRIKSIDYTIEGGDATVLTEQVVYLPEQYVVNYYSNKNCSDNRRGWIQNLSLRVTEGQTIKITNSVTSSRSNTYSLGFKIPIPKIGGELSGSTSSTVSLSTTNAQEVQKNVTTEETITKSISFDVDPKKALYVKFQTTKYSLRVPFEATLSINGYVTVQNVVRMDFGGAFSEGITEERIPIGALLSAEQRTFPIKGFLENSKAGKEEVDYAEVSLPLDSCESVKAISPFQAIAEKVIANKSLTKTEAEVLKKTNQFLLRSDLGEGRAEASEAVKNRNLYFKKYER